MYREKPRLDREEWLTRHIQKGALRIYVPMVGMPIHPGVTPPLAFYVTLPACLPWELSVPLVGRGGEGPAPEGVPDAQPSTFFHWGVNRLSRESFLRNKTLLILRNSTQKLYALVLGPCIFLE